ncbi:MAG: hypothetical protein U0793_13475 [Gemmataceae bacterium]
MSVVLSISVTFFAAGADAAKGPSDLGKAGSYEFTIQEGPAASVAGKFHKDTPIWFKADGIEFFRKGEVLVYKDAGKWQKTRTGTLSDPLRILGPSAKVRSARVPHEELATLEKVWIDVKKTDMKGKTVISGVFKEKGAKALARSEQRAVAQGGAGRVFLDEKGRLTGYEITIRLQGRLGGADVDGMATKTVTLSGIGMTTVDLPTEARKALE